MRSAVCESRIAPALNCGINQKPTWHRALRCVPLPRSQRGPVRERCEHAPGVRGERLSRDDHLRDAWQLRDGDALRGHDARLTACGDELLPLTLFPLLF